MAQPHRTNERRGPLALLLDSPPTRAAQRQQPPAHHTDTSTDISAKGLRGDIQGLRAIAVLMVLLYHGHLPFIKGGFAGVDIFFVISGFLITGLMMRELERTGTLSLRTFWARRAKRLLPATAIVLVSVSVLSLVFLPQISWAVTAGDIIAAALYVVNWRLASQSLDYLAQNYPAGPVQHFWSLAVEEQFYVVWPVLIVIIAALGRRFGWPLRRTVLIGVTALTVPSLIWSIHLGGRAEAYFITSTRGWELGIGATVALLAARLDRHLPQVLARAITWLGVLTLAAVALFLPDSLPWPGWAALIPTLATAAVIAGGPAAGPGGATYLIGRPPFRWIGDLSYSLYLWHFPLIVFATAHWNDKLSPQHGMLVVALSFLPAFLTYRLVESPLHHSRLLAKFPARALVLGAACTVIGVAAGLVLRSSIPSVPPKDTLGDHPGAAALISGRQDAIPFDQAASITPDPLQARDDVPDLYARGCQSDYVKFIPMPCEFGDPAAKVTVMLVGDSRAAQWSPALQAVAEKQHWRVVTVTKAGCPFANVMIVKGRLHQEKPYTSCTAWNAGVLKLIKTGPYHPAFVLTSSYYPYQTSINGQVQRGAQNERALINGFRSTWSSLYQAHIPVIAIRETPLMGRDVAECVANNRTSLHSCATTRDTALGTAHIMGPAAQALAGAVSIDLTLRAVCPITDCPAVIGNVLVYRDAHHLTATYSRSTAPFLSQALAALRGQNFARGSLDTILPSA